MKYFFQELKRLKDALGRLRKVFAPDKDRKETRRVASHERLGEVLKILRQVTPLTQLLSGVFFLNCYVIRKFSSPQPGSKGDIVLSIPNCETHTSLSLRKSSFIAEIILY